MPAKYRFKVDGMPGVEASFNEVSVPVPEDVTISEVTYDSLVQDDDAFKSWWAEALGKGYIGGVDIGIKDKHGFDIEHWVWKRWVPRWVAWTLCRLPDWRPFIAFQRLFMRLTCVYKNCYIKSVSYTDDGETAVSEVDIEGR